MNKNNFKENHFELIFIYLFIYINTPLVEMQPGEIQLGEIQLREMQLREMQHFNTTPLGEMQLSYLISLLLLLLFFFKKKY